MRLNFGYRYATKIRKHFAFFCLSQTSSCVCNARNTSALTPLNTLLWSTHNICYAAMPSANSCAKWLWATLATAVSIAVLLLSLYLYSPNTPPLPFRTRYPPAITTIADLSTALSSKQTAKLDEVADLMLQIYRTLADMRILNAAGIEEGPHDLTHLLPAYNKHGLAPEVIYLYGHLPYIGPAAGASDFLWGSMFADYRYLGDVEQGRDPLHAGPRGREFEAEDGQYMRAWYTPLVNMGNHQSVWIYDAKQHRIWSIDQEWAASSDPALRGIENSPDHRNRNRIEYIPSRPAGEFLRDIVKWLRTLELVPGGGEHDGGNWDEEAWRELYKANGWPDHFDADAFEIARARWSCGEDAKYHAEEPLRVLEKFELWGRYAQDNIDRAKTAVTSADNDDQRWLGMFEVWKAQQGMERNRNELKRAREEAERLCPGGVCQRPEDLRLWEAEFCRAAAESAVDREDKDALISRLAYEASLGDAQRLRPGVTFQSATGHEHIGQDRTARDIGRDEELLEEIAAELDAVKVWGEQVPRTASKAQAAVQTEIEKYEKWLKGVNERLERTRKWLADPESFS